MKYTILLLIIISCKPAPSEPISYETYKQPVILDIYTVLKKTQKTTDSVFGKPFKVIKNPKDCANLSSCNKEVQYDKWGVTILFKNNRAMWFEFANLDTLKFSNMAAIFGLNEGYPEKMANDGTVWHYRHLYKDIETIAFIKKGRYSEFIDYAIVEATE